MPNSAEPSANEDHATSCCSDWKKTVDDLGACTGDFVRKEPVQAVGLAFLAGLVLTVLPVGRLAAALLRLAFALVRPALLILGAIKLCEEFDKRNNR